MYEVISLSDLQSVFRYYHRKSFLLFLLKCPLFYQPRQQWRKKVSNILHVTAGGGKQAIYIQHEYILLTDRNDTSGRSFNRCESLEARFWYRKYFEYLEDIGYPKGRCIQRLELQVASGFRDASWCPPYALLLKYHGKCASILNVRFTFKCARLVSFTRINYAT